MQKKLQKHSAYEEYDEDGDGVVSDEELAHVTEIKKLEHDLRKQRAQRRMLGMVQSQREAGSG